MVAGVRSVYLCVCVWGGVMKTEGEKRMSEGW